MWGICHRQYRSIQVMHPNAPTNSPFPMHFVDCCKLSEAQKRRSIGVMIFLNYFLLKKLFVKLF